MLQLIERKAAGEEIVTPAAAPEADRVVDLMAALEASVQAAKEARKRHPTGRDDEAAPRDGEGEGNEAEDAPADAKSA